MQATLFCHLQIITLFLIFIGFTAADGTPILDLIDTFNNSEILCAEADGWQKLNDEVDIRREQLLTSKQTISDEENEDDDGEDEDMQMDKVEPTIKCNSSRFVRNMPITVTISSDAPFHGVILQARLFSTGASLGHFHESNQHTNHSYIRGEHLSSSSSSPSPSSTDSYASTVMCKSAQILQHLLFPFSPSPVFPSASPTPPPPSPPPSSPPPSPPSSPFQRRGDTMFSWNSSDQQTSRSFVWVYVDEENLIGEFIYFVASVYAGKTRIWKNITSLVIPFDRDAVGVDMSECGRTKGCFRYLGFGQSTCRWSSCQYLLTYHTTGTEAHFEMSGKSSWVAVGFSSDNKMGGDDVFVCCRTRNGVEVRHYVTELGHVTPTLRDKNPFYNMEGSAHGLDWSSPSSNVTLTCRFSRSLKVMQDHSSVDLSATWFQLYAWGQVSSSDTILRHTLERPPTSKMKMTLRTTRNEMASESAPQRHGNAPLTVVSFIFFYGFICLCESN